MDVFEGFEAYFMLKNPTFESVVKLLVYLIA